MEMQIRANSIQYANQQKTKHKQAPGDRNLNAGAIFPKLGRVKWILRDNASIQGSNIN